MNRFLLGVTAATGLILSGGTMIAAAFVWDYKRKNKELVTMKLAYELSQCQVEYWKNKAQKKDEA